MQIMVVSYTIWQIGKVFPPFGETEKGLSNAPKRSL